MEEINNKFPQIYSLVYFLYFKPSTFSLAHIHHVGDRHRKRRLSGTFFCLCLYHLVMHINESFKLDLNIWYMDNGSVVGEAEQVLEIYYYIVIHGPRKPIHAIQINASLYSSPGKLQNQTLSQK